MTIQKERLGLLFILIGPGGAGKNTLMNYVLSRLDDLKQLPTATTRPIRPTEKQGREHIFLNHEGFQEMIDNDDLIEYQEVRPGQYYGVPRSTVREAIDETRDLIADIEVLGASIINDEYPENTVLIFVTPPSMQRLEDQMRERGTGENVIRDRMHRADMEMTYAPLCDYVIINDELNTASDQLYDLITTIRTGARASQPTTIIYEVTCRVVYDTMQLVRTDGEHLSARVSQGESPHACAQQTVKTTFGAKVTPDTVVQADDHAVDIRHDGNTYTIHYHYVWTPAERITAPDGWQWIKGANA